MPTAFDTSWHCPALLLHTAGLASACTPQGLASGPTFHHTHRTWCTLILSWLPLLLTAAIAELTGSLPGQRAGWKSDTFIVCGRGGGVPTAGSCLKALYW